MSRFSSSNVPPMKSIPESFFEDLEAHVRELEATLGQNERIAFVYNQTGETIVVERITYRGMGIILWGIDSHGTRTSVFANMNSLQIAFKIIEDTEDTAQVKRRPIGFDTKPSYADRT